jgi:hypothetical protein
MDVKTTFRNLVRDQSVSICMLQYQRPILCTLNGAVDFFNVLKKGCWGGGGGVLLIHNEIHYVPIGDGWEEVLVRNVLHYVPVLLLACLNPCHIKPYQSWQDSNLQSSDS